MYDGVMSCPHRDESGSHGTVLPQGDGVGVRGELWRIVIEVSNGDLNSSRSLVREKN